MTGKNAGWMAFFAAAILTLAAVLLLKPGKKADIPEPAPAGDFALARANAYFVDNPHMGRLYVVEGSVANNMASPRCRIVIKAVLLDAAGGVVAQESLEAAMTASVSELKFLDRGELRRKLDAPGDRACEATRVEPGGSAPFMAVFENPPDKAATFRLVVTGSQTSPPTSR